MALEKTKKDKIEIPENIKKTKRNRHKTECSINRMKGCGICGSLNVATQGISYCNVCGEEIEILSDQFWYYGIDGVPCNCNYESKIPRFKGRKYRDIRHITVEKCLDCGAVKSRFCPNCKDRRSNDNCWKSWDGKKFCQSCGYRKN